MNSQGKITETQKAIMGLLVSSNPSAETFTYTRSELELISNTIASHSQYTEKEESIVKEPNEYYCSFKKMCDQLDEEHKRQFCGCYNTPPKAIVKEPNEVEKPLEDISDGKVTVENFEQEFLDAWSQSNSVQSCLELIRKKGFKF